MISNASWLPRGEKSSPLPVDALGSKILCERHNSMLSYLDASAKVFLTNLLQAFSKPKQGAMSQRVSVSGDDLELWILKALCGIIASGNLVRSARVQKQDLPRTWIDILFSERPWEEGTGLHIRQDAMTPYLGYELGPMYSNETLIGGGIELLGIQLFVLLDSDTEKRMLERSSGQVRPLVYRPGAIRIESSRRSMEIKLEWNSWVPTSGGVLYYT